MKNTQNLKLSKPEGSDLVKVSDLNINWDALDRVIGSPDALETVSKNSLISALNEINAKVESGVGGEDGNYILPKASPSILGGVKIGQGVSIDVGGVLSTNSNVAWVSDMLSKIGLLESLTTAAKDSLVNAINEIHAKTGGVGGNVTWESLTGKPSHFPSTPSLSGLDKVQNFGIATEQEALLGTSNEAYMTPLRVQNKINNQLGWKEIKANENLDHYKVAGNYYCPLNVSANTITNAPFGAVAFSLMVLKNAGCTQIATTYSNGSERMKIRNEYQGNWGTWIEFANKNDIESLKQSVSNGKISVANAITAKGVATSTNAEFATMATNIGNIAVPNIDVLGSSNAKGQYSVNMSMNRRNLYGNSSTKSYNYSDFLFAIMAGDSVSGETLGGYTITSTEYFSYRKLSSPDGAFTKTRSLTIPARDGQKYLILNPKNSNLTITTVNTVAQGYEAFIIFEILK